MIAGSSSALRRSLVGAALVLAVVVGPSANPSLGAVGQSDPAVEAPDGPGSDEQAPTRDVGVLTYEGRAETVQGDATLWIGALLLGVALAIVLALVLPLDRSSAQSRRRRLGRRSLASDAEIEEPGSGWAIGSVREAAVGVASRAVGRTESAGKIDERLDRAGLIMRAGEFVALVVAVALAAGLVLYLVLGVVGAALGLLVPTLGAKSFLDLKASRRNKRFGDQLSDALQILSGSLRSGFGIGQAIDTVAEEMDDPVGAEFRRAILETRLGRDVEDALDGIAARVQNEDFEWVVDAMRINRQVGGDLAQILDQVGETIRARNRLRRQVAALTAEGRMSALVLGVLPIGIGVILYSSNPDYMEPLFSRTIGLVMLGVAVGLLAIGALWLKKLIDVEM